MLVSQLSGRGGTEKVVEFWMKHIFVDSNDVKISYFSPDGLKESASTTHFYVELKSFSNYSLKPTNNILGGIRLLIDILSHNYDLVICTTTKLIAAVSYIRKVFNKHFKIISWVHSSIFDEPSLDPSKMRLADFHLAISDGIREQLKSLGINDGIYTIYNPIKIPPVNKIINNKKMDNRLRLAYVGRIMWEGPKNMKELFNSLLYLHVKWTLFVIGEGDRNNKSIIKKFIKENKMEKNIHFLGWQSDPFPQLVLNKVDFVISTSKYEGFSLVLAEAGSYGMGMISSDCPVGPADIVNHNNGRLYNVNDTKSLARILNNGLEIREDLSSPNEMREEIKKKFSESSYINNVERALRAIVNQK